MRTHSSNWEAHLASNQNIFVTIPSLNENDLLNTISDLYSKADNPQSVFVGICNQKTDGQFEDFSQFENVRFTNIDSDKIRGIGIARIESLWLWSGQKYILQIDAHSRFVESWDSILIAWYLKLESLNPNCVISQRPCAFTKTIDGKINFDESIPSIQKLREFQILDATEKLTKSEFSSEQRNAISNNISHVFEYPEFVEHYFVAGGFIFSIYKFFMDVLPDPRIAFFGEEHTLPIRASANGYSIYAINERVVYTLEKTDEYLNSADASANWHNIYSVDSVSTTYLHFFDSYTKILLGQEFGYYGATDIIAYETYIDNMGFDYRSIEGIYTYD
jgi:hypothetical protein